MTKRKHIVVLGGLFILACVALTWAMKQKRWYVQLMVRRGEYLTASYSNNMDAAFYELTGKSNSSDVLWSGTWESGYRKIDNTNMTVMRYCATLRQVVGTETMHSWTNWPDTRERFLTNARTASAHSRASLYRGDPSLRWLPWGFEQKPLLSLEVPPE